MKEHQHRLDAAFLQGMLLALEVDEAVDRLATARLRQIVENLERRAELDENRLYEVRREERKKCAALAYSVPGYIPFNTEDGFPETDEYGVMKPGSPYDRGRYDAMCAILKKDREEDAMVAEALSRNA